MLECETNGELTHEWREAVNTTCVSSWNPRAVVTHVNVEQVIRVSDFPILTNQQWYRLAILSVSHVSCMLVKLAAIGMTFL